MNLFRMVYVFTPTIMIYFGLLLPDRSSLYPLALVVIVFPALAPKGQQRHDNQKVFIAVIAFVVLAKAYVILTS